MSSSLGLGFGLEQVFVFDSKSENRDRAIEAVESVPEARAVRVRVRAGHQSGLGLSEVLWGTVRLRVGLGLGNGLGHTASTGKSSKRRWCA